jgi:hypothetical protein
MLMVTVTKSPRIHPSLKRHPKKRQEKNKGKPKPRNLKSEEKNSQGKYVIKVGDFEAMSKYVAETNTVEVPHQTAIGLEGGILGLCYNSSRVCS